MTLVLVKYHTLGLKLVVAIERTLKFGMAALVSKLGLSLISMKADYLEARQFLEK